MGRGANLDRWKDRRVLASLLGIAIFLVPIACAVAVTLAVERLVPRPAGTGTLLLWWVGILAVSTSVFGAFETVARRALPLKVLLRMGLAFPGRAPKRLTLAWRAASVRDLDRMVTDARERGIATADAGAMEKVVTLAAALGARDRKVLRRMGLALSKRTKRRRPGAWRAAGEHELERIVADARERGLSGDTIDAAEKIVTLAAALSAHDRTTRGHSERVRAVTDLIARELHLSSADRDRLRWSALLHDVGKLAVHPDILNKSADLDDDEWEVIRRHPLEGARLTAPLAGWLGAWSETIAEHHERFDGMGYPKGLRGRDISLGGRIVAVADSYDVMTATRSYKRPLGPESARRELAACAGTQFDPDVVRAFLAVAMLRLRLAAPLAWLGSYGAARIGGLARLGGMTGRTVVTGLAVAGTVAGVTLAALAPHPHPGLAAAAANGVPATGASASASPGAGTAAGSSGSGQSTDGTGGHDAASAPARGTAGTAPPPRHTNASSEKSSSSAHTGTSAPASGGAGPSTATTTARGTSPPPTPTTPLSASPGPPTGVAATGACQQGGSRPLVALTWKASATPSVTSYVVLRSDDDATFSPVATVSSTTTAFTDTFVAGNVTYWYEVAAVAAGGTATSGEVRATPPSSCP
jgi:HD-GYP domain-containing protein (c-di-GMP phosphodiesterase class II)